MYVHVQSANINHLHLTNGRYNRFREGRNKLDLHKDHNYQISVSFVARKRILLSSIKGQNDTIAFSQLY